MQELESKPQHMLVIKHFHPIETYYDNHGHRLIDHYHHDHCDDHLGTPGIFTAGCSLSKTGVAAGVTTSSITCEQFVIV